MADRPLPPCTIPRASSLAGAPLAGARAATILLHGRGGSADDIASLATVLAVDRMAYLVPEATGHTWYPQRFIAPLAANEPWLGSALGVVGALVAQARAAGIPDARIAIGGFSQGACLALEFVARTAGPLRRGPGLLRRPHRSARGPAPPGAGRSHPGRHAGLPRLRRSGRPHPARQRRGQRDHPARPRRGRRPAYLPGDGAHHQPGRDCRRPGAPGRAGYNPARPAGPAGPHAARSLRRHPHLQRVAERSTAPCRADGDARGVGPALRDHRRRRRQPRRQLPAPRRAACRRSAAARDPLPPQFRPDRRLRGRLRPRARRHHRDLGRRSAERSARHPGAGRRARARRRHRLRLAARSEGHLADAAGAVDAGQPADLGGDRRPPARLRLLAQGVPRRSGEAACASTARCTASSRPSPARSASASPSRKSTTAPGSTARRSTGCRARCGWCSTC